MSSARHVRGNRCAIRSLFGLSLLSPRISRIQFKSHSCSFVSFVDDPRSSDVASFTLSPCRPLTLSSSILRSARIDILIPQQNPTRHALDVLEALLAQNLGELHRAGAAAAVDDDLVLFVAFDLAQTAADLLQRDQLRAVDV